MAWPPSAAAETLVDRPVVVDAPAAGRAEGDQGPVLIATAGAQSAAVYYDDRDGRLHAALVDGVTAGASRNSTALAASATLEDADLAGGTPGFLLVWTEAGIIRGQRLTVSGSTITAGAAFDIATGGTFSQPRAAFGSAEWLVAFRVGNGSTGAVRRALVGTDSGVSVLAGDLIANAGSFDLVGTAAGYGLSYVSLPAPSPVRLLEVDTSGNFADEATLSNPVSGAPRVESTTTTGGGVTVWFDPGAPLFGQTWDANFNRVGPISATRLSPIGVPVDEAATAAHGASAAALWRVGDAIVGAAWDGVSSPTQFVTLAAANAQQVEIADGSAALVAYSLDDGAGGDVFQRRFDVPTAGVEVPITVGTGPRTSAVAVMAGAELVVAFTAPNGTNEGVWLTSLDEGGGVDAGPTLISSGAVLPDSVTGVYAEGTLLVAWVDESGTLVGRRFPGADPAQGDAEVVLCADADAGSLSATPAGGIDGAAFLLYYADAATTSVRLVGLPLTGPPVDECGPTLNDTTPAAHPRAAADDTGAMIVWLAGSPGSRSVRAKHLSFASGFGAEFELVAAAADPGDLDVASLGNGEWLLASVRPDAANGGSDLVLTRFDTAGNVLATVTVPAPTLDETDSQPRLFGAAGQAAVLWQRGASAPSVRHASFANDALVAGSLVEVVPASALIGGPLAVTGTASQTPAVVSRERDAAGDERLSVRAIRTDAGPFAHAGGPYGTIDEGDLLDLDGSGSQGTTPSPIVTWDWQVGPQSASGETTTLLVEDDGLFGVELEVTDDDGLTDIDVATVNVLNVAPELTLLGTPYNLVEGTPREFQLTVVEPGNDVVELTWDLGDGTIQTGTADDLDSLIHVYDQGSYTLCVLADDGDGGTDEACAPVNVANAAPTVALAVPPALSEGAVLDLDLTIADAGGDPLDISYTFGDGTSDLDSDASPPYPDAVVHTYANNRFGANVSPFNLCVTVTDDSAASNQACRLVSVANVAPDIVGTPAATAVEGIDGASNPLVYTATFNVVEPGSDPLTVTFDAGGLSGVSLDWQPGPRTATVSFTPTLAQWRSRQPATWTFTLTARDGEALGGTDVFGWNVTIVPEDENGDGLADTCERLYGVSGGAADSDSDGASNAAECLAGTHAGQDDRPPSAPGLNAPAKGATVTTLTPTLSVTNVPHGVGVSYRIVFELYDDAALLPGDLVASHEMTEQVGLTTAWTTPLLNDLQMYYWRARALNGAFGGPWMSVSDFTVELPNAAPETPEALTPSGLVRTLTPELVWTTSEDPDGESVTYRLEFHSDEDLTQEERRYTGIIGGDGQSEVTFEIPDEAPLPDNATLFWRVVAVDERGRESEPSNLLEILVNSQNDVPGTPTIVAPEDGATVNSATPELIVTSVEDIDGDPVTYAFVIAGDEDFTDIVESVANLVPSAGDGLVHHTMTHELVENGTYHWRAAARDPRNLGGFVEASFFVDTVNDPPFAPTFQHPADNQVLDTLTPELRVRNAVEPEADPVTYDFEVSAALSFGDVVFSAYGVAEGEEETAVTVDEPLEDGASYFARARAVDEGGAAGAWAAPVEFEIQVGPPGLRAPQALSPIDGAEVPGDEVVLRWRNVDGVVAGPITYEVGIYLDEVLANSVYGASDIAEELDETAHDLTEALDPGTYYWVVRASDGEQTGPWSDTASFVATGEANGGGDVEADTGGGGADAGTDTGAEPDPTSVEGCECSTGGRGSDAWWMLVVLTVVATRQLPGRRRRAH